MKNSIIVLSMGFVMFGTGVAKAAEPATVQLVKNQTCLGGIVLSRPVFLRMATQ